MKSPYLHIALIGVLTFICYGRILGSYFLADDFGEIQYISQIFNGNFKLLLSNFTGNYMQIPSMAVYRPWLLMSLAIDFAIWKTNAFGYYLTNIAHYYACSVLIYLLLKKLTGYWGVLRSSLTAFSAGAIFACNPLHCESISWVVGRVDIVCLSFYLCGLLLVAHYTESRKLPMLLGSAICFWFAIFTKEMAIGLPAMACTIAFLCEDSQKTDKGSEHNSDSIKERIFAQLQKSIKSTKLVFLVFTICTITYFCIRYLALGTFTGGYTGSMGASQLSNILTKWLDPDSLFRILYPFNYALMKDGGIYRSILSFAYFLTGSLMICRLIFGRWPKRLLLLVFIWLLTSLAPIYQLYGLGYNLEGMRFLFFATAPLSLAIPVILFAPWFEPYDDNKKSYQQKTEKRYLALSTLAVTCLIFTFAKSSYINNSPWIEAGKQTKSVTKQIQNLAKNTPEGEKIAVLGIPKENAGSHMILNGPTLSFLLAPPFTKKLFSEKVVSFEPVLYGNKDSINVQHFKWALDNKSIKKYYAWDFDKRSFQELPINQNNESSPQIIEVSPPGPLSNSSALIWPHSTTNSYSFELNSTAKGITFSNAFSGIGLEVTPLNIKPRLIDYLEIEIPKEDFNRIAGKSINLSWIGASGNSSKKSQKHKVDIDSKSSLENRTTNKIRIPLSSFWQWFTYSEINHLFIEFPATEKLTILTTRLLPLENIAPALQVTNLSPLSYGIYSLATKNKLSLTIKPIAISIPDTHHIEVQIAKSNYFFENFKSDKVKNAIWKSIKIDNKSNTIDIRKTDFEDSGYNQIRAKCVGQNGDTIGQMSYPVTVVIPD